MNTRNITFLMFLSIALNIISAPAKTMKITKVAESKQVASRSTKKSSRIRHSTNTKKRKVVIKNMNEDELKALQKESLAKKNYSAAIKCLERRLKLTHNLDEIADLLFELANIQFDAGNLDTSITLYDDFKKRFGGHANAEDAYYKSALAAHLTSLDPERDQTRTERAIELANEYLNQGLLFTKFTNEIQLMRSDAFQKLADREFSICKFYKRRGNIKAVTKRLAYVEERLLPELPTLQTQLIQIKQELGLLAIPEEIVPATTVAQHGKHMQDRF